MNSDEASQLLWQSLWDVEQYLREGIAKQLNASTSFSGDDMIPVHEAIRTFQIVSPLLPPGAQSTVERVFSETTSGLNGFLDSLRAGIEISKTDVAQRQAAIGRANKTLNQALQTYRRSLEGEVSRALFADVSGHAAEGNQDPAPGPDGPTPAAEADAPFIFVSYARDERQRLLPHVERMAQWGCRVWYDRGIPGTAEWVAVIEDRIRRCQLFMVFLSQRAAESRWVRREVLYADKQKKPILTVKLGDVELGAGLDLVLSPYQMISEEAHEFSEELKRAIEYVRLL